MTFPTSVGVRERDLMTFVKRPSKQALSDAIFDCGGVVSQIGKRYGVTRKQVYVWIHRYELQGEVERARDFIEVKGHSTLRDLLESPDMNVRLKAAMRILDASDRRKGFMNDRRTAVLAGL